MKILQLTDTLGNGGAEKFVVELSNELARTHEVILCSVKPVENWMQPPKKLSGDVELRSLQIKQKFSLQSIYRMFGLFRESKPDIVHVHSSILVFTLYLLTPFFRKTKFIQTIHNTFTPGYVKLMDFISLTRFLNKDFVHVCISDFIYQEFTRKYPRLNFQKIDNGIVPMLQYTTFESATNEPSGYKFNPETKVFTAIGNYSGLKNFVLLTGVFNEMRREGHNIVLLLIGAGKEGISLENYKQVESIREDGIYQLGFQSNVAQYLAVTDALVVSSLKEGMPLVALEALSLGIPIVTTPAGGMVDIVRDNENGFLAEGFSKEAIKAAITRFINATEPDLAQIRINNKNKFMQKYAMSICAGNYEKLYQKITMK